MMTDMDPPTHWIRGYPVNKTLTNAADVCCLIGLRPIDLAENRLLPNAEPLRGRGKAKPSNVCAQTQTYSEIQNQPVIVKQLTSVMSVETQITDRTDAAASTMVKAIATQVDAYDRGPGFLFDTSPQSPKNCKVCGVLNCHNLWFHVNC